MAKLRRHAFSAALYEGEEEEAAAVLLLERLRILRCAVRASKDSAEVLERDSRARGQEGLAWRMLWLAWIVACAKGEGCQ